MAKINQKEYEILKNLDDQWKWIARDETDDDLFAHTLKPIKQENGWANIDFGYKFLQTIYFQFIKWDDKDPHNIAELIEEYEYSAERVSHVVNERVEALCKAWKESKETEMKSKQDLIEKWELAIESAEFYGKGKEEELIGYMKEFVSDLKQLEEPEVLTEEQAYDIIAESFPATAKEIELVLEKYYSGVLIGFSEELRESIMRSFDAETTFKNIEALTGKTLEQIAEEAINGGIVTKQELPVIPKFVADYLEFEKGNVSLMRVMELANTRYEWPKREKEYAWISANDETFARAWLDGYEVGNEPKYFAKAKGHELMTSKHQVVYWAQKINDGTIRISTLGHTEVYKNKMTLQEWDDLGINEGNADFVKVEELE